MAFFIRALTPLAEDLGMYLAIHPDDPPRSLLGLPRVVSTSQDVKELLGSDDFDFFLNCFIYLVIFRADFSHLFILQKLNYEDNIVTFLK